MVEKLALHRVGEILGFIREYILKLPLHNSNEEGLYNRKIKELYNELDKICRETHTPFFRYKYVGMGQTVHPKQVIEINTVEDARTVYGEYEIIESQIAWQYQTPEPNKEYIARCVENDLLSQAKEWLDDNKESLVSLTGPMLLLNILIGLIISFFKKYFLELIISLRK